MVFIDLFDKKYICIQQRRLKRPETYLPTQEMQLLKLTVELTLTNTNHLCQDLFYIVYGFCIKYQLTTIRGLKYN